MATEAILADLPPVRETQGKPKIAVVAHDLRIVLMADALFAAFAVAVVINKNVVAGDDFTIRHGVTIGNRGADNMACPHIGNGVELGANVIILGDITLGNNVTVGAGSVVLDSVPDNALVVGEKARVKVIK